jgi:hypothetical protein
MIHANNRGREEQGGRADAVNQSEKATSGSGKQSAEKPELGIRTTFFRWL